MNPLPQLTTVRKDKPQSQVEHTKGLTNPLPDGIQPLLQTAPPVSPPARGLVPHTSDSQANLADVKIEAPGLPAAAKQTFAELIQIGLVSANDLPEIFAKLGSRVGSMQTRERTLDTLTAAKFLTPYLTTRFLSGQTHGLTFGPFRVLDRISSGSVGVVFRGEHVRLKRPVAIKSLPVEEQLNPGLIERFFKEVRILAELNHPHLPTVYDYGELPGFGPGQPATIYLVMELLAGGDLENFIYTQGIQDLATTCEWARQTAMALRACHAAGFIHRDVKPSNLLLSEAKQIKLTDFGLARDFSSVLTPAKALLGSIEFLAPEQLADAPTASEASDVYGLGCTLFWLLSGQLPYPQQRSVAEAVELIRTAKPRRLSEIRDDVPPELVDLLADLLAKNPASRPPLNKVIQELTKFAMLSQAGVNHTVTPATETEYLRHTIRHLETIQRTTAMQLEEARTAILTGLCSVAAQQQGESLEHQNRVGAYTHLLASHLGNDVDWIQYSDARTVAELSRVSGLHDLGLVAVPRELLSNTATLTISDRDAYEHHTICGDSILDQLAREHGDSLPFLRTARAVVRHHHERWDGLGFPDRLKETAIPPAARIVAVAICYDHDRLQGNTHAEAVAQIRGEAGRSFDPAVVSAFEAVCDTFDFIFTGIKPASSESVAEQSKNAQIGPNANTPAPRLRNQILHS